MPRSVKFRRRVTSGNIKDPELHQQRLANMQRSREATWTITVVLAGAVAIVAVAIVMSLGH